MSDRSYRVAVVGATGAVGPEVLSILAERRFPASDVVPFASARSAGTRVDFAGEQLEVRELTEDSLAQPGMTVQGRIEDVYSRIRD